jgi:hypothetical protein
MKDFLSRFEAGSLRKALMKSQVFVWIAGVLAGIIGMARWRTG